MTPYRAHNTREVTVGETLGDDSCAYVVQDTYGDPCSYNGLNALSGMVASQEYRVSVDVHPQDGSNGWQNVARGLNLGVGIPRLFILVGPGFYFDAKKPG